MSSLKEDRKSTLSQEMQEYVCQPEDVFLSSKVLRKRTLNEQNKRVSIDNLGHVGMIY